MKLVPAKISVGCSLPYTDQSKVSRNMNDCRIKGLKEMASHVY